MNCTEFAGYGCTTYMDKNGNVKILVLVGDSRMHAENETWTDMALWEV